MNDWEWSLFEASKVFFRTYYDDLGGAGVRRGRMISHFWCSQKMLVREHRELTYLYTETRHSRRPLIFIHGSPGDGSEWEKFLHYPHEYSICAIDRPGFGMTYQEKPNLEMDMVYLSDLMGILSVDAKPILVGHSLGAGIAARLAADFPGSIAGLVLVGGSLNPVLEKVRPVQKIFAHPALSWILTRSIRHSNDELMQYGDFLKNLKPRLRNIICSVSVVHAKDDRLVPFENVDYIVEQMTNAKEMHVMPLAHGGHFLNYTQPTAILKAVRKVDPDFVSKKKGS